VVDVRKILVSLVLISLCAFGTTNFEYSVEKLIVFEGSDVDRSIGTIHSRYGITRPTLKRYNGRVDVENLTKEVAKDIIYKLYWKEFELDRIMDKRSALLVLDFIYNSNSYNALKQIDKCLGVKVDGKLSVIDISKINYMGYKAFYEVYSKQRLNYMKSLKNWNQFSRGWKFRVEELGKL
jgi:lysozyme family protein